MWLNPQGQETIIGLGAIVCHDTLTCAHCNRLTRIRARERPEDIGGFCTVCAELICAKCVGKGCDPLEKKLERIEARGRALRSYEQVMAHGLSTIPNL